MGNCFSDNVVDPNQKNQAAASSRRIKKPGAGTSSKTMINMSDFMGIKRSDGIDNFYDIDTVIGRGKNQKSLYLFRGFRGSSQG
jgi:hypothetical protein